ncbi:MAG: OsmC family protein [Sphingobacteriaceae bacterium]|nr:OsmC family protein [Sphingobacteriaceae bacterium]
METTAHYYNVSVKWESDRKGLLTSPELNSNVEVVTPPQFPKGIEGIWSPEHLFVAAVNSCLMTTFLSIAENSKLDYVSFESNANGKLEIVDGKYMMSEVTLEPVLIIKDIQQKEKAERVLQKSESNCLISNSIKSKINFKPTVLISEN